MHFANMAASLIMKLIVAQLVHRSVHFYGCDSLPCSHKPANETRPEPDESSPHNPPWVPEIPTNQCQALGIHDQYSVYISHLSVSSTCQAHLILISPELQGHLLTEHIVKPISSLASSSLISYSPLPSVLTLRF
jgi:hypothetical protein